MVEYADATASEGLNLTFSALADPTRRAILARLQRGPALVTEVAEPFDLSLNGVSKHIRVLERAGLVSRRVSGREHELSLQAQPLRAATAWTNEYERFWDDRLDALGKHLRKRKKGR